MSRYGALPLPAAVSSATSCSRRASPSRWPETVDHQEQIGVVAVNRTCNMFVAGNQGLQSSPTFGQHGPGTGPGPRAALDAIPRARHPAPLSLEPSSSRSGHVAAESAPALVSAWVGFRSYMSNQVGHGIAAPGNPIGQTGQVLSCHVESPASVCNRPRWMEERVRVPDIKWWAQREQSSHQVRGMGLFPVHAGVRPVRLRRLCKASCVILMQRV